MRNSVIETFLGLIVVFTAIGFLAYGISIASSGTVKGYTIQAEFGNLASVSPGADVRVGGIKIGSVVGQQLDPVTYFPVITLNIDPRYKIPVDSVASVGNDGLMGGPFIALSIGSSEDTIPPGGMLNRTQDPVDVVDQIGRAIFSGGGM